VRVSPIKNELNFLRVPIGPNEPSVKKVSSISNEPKKLKVPLSESEPYGNPRKIRIEI